LNLQQLRVHAITHSLFPPTHLKAAIDRLGFVQADPIRSPARAQDLILRQRVKGYRAGDLERRYADLDLEEDFLYAYGFVPRTVWQLLHPREARGLKPLEKKVLEVIQKVGGDLHPKELEAHLGRQRAVNAWGRYSKATTHALQHLHYRGLLRIARRVSGIRIYQAMAAPPLDSLPLPQRLQKVVMLVANILAPVPEKSLREALGRLRHLGDARAQLQACDLERHTVDGLTYVWPASSKRKSIEVPRAVRILSPFDPLVWDRRRFEHLWGWQYRFEAYTPAAKRVRGYYAMPILWHEAMIGWANLSVTAGQLDAPQLGFVGERPADADFRRALDQELARIGYFLGSLVGGTIPLSRK
jgi:uncharacterized protein YcaQ